MYALIMNDFLNNTYRYVVPPADLFEPENVSVLHFFKIIQYYKYNV